VALVLESAMLETTADALVLDMGEPVKITELADDLITALGLSPTAVRKEIVGLRPGEKLHEALWDLGDEVSASGHPRLLAVRQRVRRLADVEQLVAEIERLALDGQVERLLARVRELVPSYHAPHHNGGPAVVELRGRKRVTEDPAVATPVAAPHEGLA